MRHISGHKRPAVFVLLSIKWVEKKVLFWWFAWFVFFFTIPKVCWVASDFGLDVSAWSLDDRAPKTLGERKIAAWDLLCLHWHLTAQEPSKNRGSCLWYLGHVTVHHFDIFGSFWVGRSAAGFLTSALVSTDEMNQKTRSTSTLMREMLDSQFNRRRCTFRFPGQYFKFFWYHRLLPRKMSVFY